MTDTVIKQAKPRLLTYVNWAVALTSLALMGFGFVDLVRFQMTANADMNPSTWENHVWYWGLAAGLLFIAIAAAPLSEDNSSLEDGWIYRLCQQLQRSTGVHAFPCFLALVAAFPASAILVMHAVPHRLYTPAGFLRVMDDGRVFSPGQSVVSDRYEAHSALVPLTHAIDARYDLPLGGHTLAATMQLSYRLATGPELTRLLSSHPRELGAGLRQNAQADAQGSFFRQQAGLYLQPKLATLEHEMASNGLSGSLSSLHDRLGTLLDQSRDRPIWLAGVAVEGLEFSGVTDYKP